SQGQRLQGSRSSRAGRFERNGLWAPGSEAVVKAALRLTPGSDAKRAPGQRPSGGRRGRGGTDVPRRARVFEARTMTCRFIEVAGAAEPRPGAQQAERGNRIDATRPVVWLT